MGVLSRIFTPSAVKAAEGQYRDGPWLVGGGWLPASVGQYLNWWQNGHSPRGGFEASAIVEACVSAYAQTIAMCPGDHWRTRPDGGRDRVDNSALARILRRPNDYQSISDFLLNLTRSLYLDGNAYALALRNDRYEITELHLMTSRHCGPRIADTGDVFYTLGGNEIVERRFKRDDLMLVPARDVLHIRLNTPRHPLKGEPPIAAAAMDLAASGAMTAQQIAFWQNEAKPSYILGTELSMTATQVAEFRERWNAVTRGEGAGGTPILTNGIKPLPMSTNANDAQLADMMKLSEQRIALTFRIPFAILGLAQATNASTEALMQQWKSSGLGFALGHIEESFGQMFGLRGMPTEYIEFDTAMLMRSQLKDRIEALARGVQGGIFAPNEARRLEGYGDVPYGDQPRVQQQVVPLDWHANNPAPAPVPIAPPPAQDALPSDGGDKDFAELIREAARRHEARIH